MKDLILPPSTARASGWILRTLMDRLSIRYMAFVRYLEEAKQRKEWDGIASRTGIRDALAARTTSPRLMEKLKEFVGKELFEPEMAKLFKLYPTEFTEEEE